MSEALLLSLEHRGPSRVRPDLLPFAATLDELDNPERTFRSCIVVGTNGKGSTATMLARILEAHGVHTGLYTSPHLVDVCERIELDGKSLTSNELTRLLHRLEAYPQLTYFETLTAAAFLAFAEAGVDYAVLEAGVGARWDATQAARSTLAGLTNVGSDHTAWLGSNREAVAHEKGHALAQAKLAFVGPQVEHSLYPHFRAAHALPASSIISLQPLGEQRCLAQWPGGETVLELPLAGEHQQANLCLALALAFATTKQGVLRKLEPRAVRHGLAQVRWPGRLSAALIDGREVVLDGAHNLEAAQALAKELESRPVRFNLMFSCLADKPVMTMAQVLRPLVNKVAVCELDDQRAMPLSQLQAAFPEAVVARTPSHALDLLPDPVVAAGSLRLVGALLARARGAA